MYCINCGVKMADGEKECPLCKTRVYHPEFLERTFEKQYPEKKYPKREMRSKFWQGTFTFAYVLCAMTVTLCDIQINKTVVWSGYVLGALLFSYVSLILPMWFSRPNPVIFVPCGALCAGVYLWYINFAVGGDWFWTFALPVLGALTAIVTTVVTLVRYLKRGRLFIFGGAFLGLGGAMVLCELLMTLTFEGVRFFGWSFHPLIAFCLLGGLLIFLGICRPARESMERKFFI